MKEFLRKSLSGIEISDEDFQRIEKLLETKNWVEKVNKIRVITEGGEGSGNYGHAGRPGEVGGSGEGNGNGNGDAGGANGGTNGEYKYSSDPEQRRETSGYAGGGSYTKVDGAIKEPVRVFNEELGISTYASCEGHAQEWGKQLGEYRDPANFNRLMGMRFQESYIAAHTTGVKDAKNLEDFLLSKGFEVGSTERKTGGEIHYDIVKKVDGGVLSFDCCKGGVNDRIAFRIRSGNFGYKTCKFGNEPSFKNIIMTGKPKSQKDWDKMRDKNWHEIISLLREWKKK